MAKFIIDTDTMAEELSLLVANSRAEYLLYALRNAHTGKQFATWITPYEEKKKRGMSGAGPYTESFEAFWAAYPARNGVKSGKRPAFKAWVKYVPPIKSEEHLLALCLAALKWQKVQENWTKSNGTFIPMGSSYLNAEGWTDEQPKGPGSGNKIAKTY